MGVDTSRPFRDPDRFFKAQLQYQNPYFEVDIEQDEMGKLLFYQTGNLINSKFCSVSLFPRQVFWSNRNVRCLLVRGAFIGEPEASNTNLKSSGAFI